MIINCCASACDGQKRIIHNNAMQRKMIILRKTAHIYNAYM